MKLDLHMHSIASVDGQYTPQELADMCGKSGLQAAALTDHNSIAHVMEFSKCMQEKGLYAIPGIELDCDCREVHLHLLGYGIDVSDKRYQELTDSIQYQKKNRSRQMMKNIHQLGIAFEEDAVLALGQDGIICGEMIAEAALADERNADNPLLAPYREGGDRCVNPLVSFYWDYCGPGKPGYIQLQFPTFEEVLSLIRNTDGFAVIAHPAITVERREDMIRYMKECGVVGMEVFSSYHTPEDVTYYRQLADRMGMIKTCGSDFHGKIKPAVHLGDTNGMTQADQNVLTDYLIGRNLIRA